MLPENYLKEELALVCSEVVLSFSMVQQPDYHAYGDEVAVGDTRMALTSSVLLESCIQA